MNRKSLTLLLVILFLGGCYQPDNNCQKYHELGYQTYKESIELQKLQQFKCWQEGWEQAKEEIK
jgi:hypothetical protein